MENNKAVQVACLLVAMCLALTGVSSGESKLPDPDGKPADTSKPVQGTTSPPGASVTIDEPGFEADGSWKVAKTGAGVNGFFSDYANYLKAGIIDPPPKRGIHYTYNNGPQHDLYQVLKATVAANTTYTLSIVAIDPTFANPFPGGKLRLGYVSADPTETDDYGLNLMTPTKVVNPTPLNDKENDPDNLADGLATWIYTFTTGATPAGLGQKLRIEVLGGGKAQSLFDNVRLEAVAATPAEINSAVRAAESPEAAPVVVMLGDSTTDRGLPKQVKKQLDELITSSLQRPIVINAGKGGDNATSALGRLEKDVLANHPDITTVSFGLNDTGGRKPDQFKESLKQIVRTLKDADIQVVLMTSTPFDNNRHGWAKQFQDLGGLDEYMDRDFCERMRSLADGKEVLLCDLHSIFKDQFEQDPDLINKVICGDGVHLTAEGNLLAAKHIAPVIHKLLTENQLPNPGFEASEDKSAASTSGPSVTIDEPGEEKTSKVTVTPEKPAALPDGSTKVSVKKESVYLGRGERIGTPQLLIGDSTLELPPNTVIAAGGFRYEFPGPFQFTFKEERREDMVFTFIESCTLTVLSSKADQPRVQLKGLSEELTVDCSRQPRYPVETIRGKGHHFVSLKPLSAEISRFHPSPELGAALQLTVVSNFGAKTLRLGYKKKEQVTIGDETISLESFDFDYPTKSMKIRVQTVPKATEATATIVRYGDASE